MRIKKTSQYIEGGAGLPSYFTDEIDTGMKWIDGKPIYQKTIRYDSFTTGEQVKYHNISNIDYIVNMEAVGKRDGSDHQDYEVLPAIVPPNYNSQYQLSLYDINKSYFRLYLGSQLQTTGTKLLELYVTLKYTKTTD